MAEIHGTGIVYELINEAYYKENEFPTLAALLRKAAEEIERLRKENAVLRKRYNEAMEQLGFTGDIESF